MVHSIIDNRYKVLSKIGQGGMGCVYEAEHAYTKRRIALKVIHQEFQLDTSYRDRFLREIELACQVQHPHAVQIMDAGEADGGLLYMAMEYLEGETLGDLLRRHPGGLGAGLVIQMLHQLGSALDAIHEGGLLHRDLKPDNIVILKDTSNSGVCNVKLLDFGIARQMNALHSLTGSRVIGTPEFMSPEQARGEKLGRQSDIYNLGLVAYSMVTGKGPFTSDTPFGFVFHHNMTPVPSMSTIKKDVPAGMDDVIQKALAKEAGERYASAHEFVDALEQASLIPLVDNVPVETDKEAVVPATMIFQETLMDWGISYPGTEEEEPPVPITADTYKRMVGIGMAVLAGMFLLAGITQLRSPQYLLSSMVPGLFYEETEQSMGVQTPGDDLVAERAVAQIASHQTALSQVEPPTEHDQSNQKELPASVSNQIEQVQTTKEEAVEQEDDNSEELGTDEGEGAGLNRNYDDTEGSVLLSAFEEIEAQVGQEGVDQLVASLTLIGDDVTAEEEEDTEIIQKTVLQTSEPEEDSGVSFRTDEHGIYIIPDQLAEVRGGMAWLQSRIRYPAQAMRANAAGEVIMRIMINEKGKIKDSVVVQSVGFGCEEEVMRVLKRAKFVAGNVDGEPVKSWVTLRFKFEKDV